MKAKQPNENIIFELSENYLECQLNRDDTSRDSLDNIIWELFGYNSCPNHDTKQNTLLSYKKLKMEEQK